MEPPRVVAILPGFIPSTQIYIVKPLLGLHRQGRIEAAFSLEAGVSPRRIEWADAVVFCRNTDPAYRWVLDYALAGRKPVVYDLDDNFFAIPTTTAVGRYHRSRERLEQLERFLRKATMVRVYSTALHECVREFNGNVVRLDGPVDWTLVPPGRPRQHPHRVRIVYATSRLEDDLADLFLEDIERLLTTYAGQLEIYFWGYQPPQLRGMSGVRFLPFIKDYDRFFYRFARYGFDIGLAPLRDDLFHRCKSDVKFREYSACWIAGVYSDVGSYAEHVEDKVTGLLVSHRPRAWFDAVSSLIEDPDRRVGIQHRAAEYARATYDLESFQEVWWGHIQELVANRRALEVRSGRKEQRPAARGPCSVAGWRGGIVGSLSPAIVVIAAFRKRGLRGTLGLIFSRLSDAAMLLRLYFALRSKKGGAK